MEGSVKFGVDQAVNSAILNHLVSDITKSVLLADSLNYDSIWMSDRINQPYIGNQVANNWILLNHLMICFQSESVSFNKKRRN
jgi:alkanesulfonate monooxygenase SsuD/methylene tetrahydromethanopterin reductase-like flavin-dependent oxidoreductase (luciferase family)